MKRSSCVMLSRKKSSPRELRLSVRVRKEPASTSSLKEKLALGRMTLERRRRCLNIQKVITSGK